MDFTYLLELAKANEEKTKEDKSFKFSTKVSNAKKISKPGPKAHAINQLLSKIDADKKKKDEEYNKKKNELLALRAQDKHSKKRVHSLINRTKGASKSVLDDAKDITTAKGEAQCDEDDYGYESTISQQIFSKLQNKYSELPEDERLKFSKTKKSSIEDIKNRVMSSLKQKQEEELGIRKRKRNRKRAGRDEEEDDGFINDGDEYKKFQGKIEESREKKKGKRKSKHDIDENLIKPDKVDKYSHFKYDKEKPREKTIEKVKKKASKSAPPPMSFEQLMKMAQKKQKEPLPIIDPLKELLEKKEKSKNEEDRPLTAKEKKEIEEDKLRKLKKLGKLPTSKEPPTKVLAKSKDLKQIPVQNNDKKIKVSKENKPIPEQPVKVADKSKYFAMPKTSTNINSSKIVKDTPKITKPIITKIKEEKKPQPKPENIPKKIPSKSYPTPSFPKKVASRPLPPPSPPSSAKRRIESDDEDEYDSEMDDFIDDGDIKVDYSNEIAKLFNYDKSKYRDMDDDVDDMEASYSQMQKEEIYSAKVGLQEDLEDIRREEEEKKRKKMLLKKKRKL